jgi:hypothetical protein
MNHAAIQALDAALRSLVADEQRTLVRFLRHLDVLDREQGYAALNCGSTFDYLVRELHLAEGTAWRRVNAMRLIRRFPVLEAALDDGRLNPTQLGVLRPVLTAENVDDLVLRATHLTKAKTKELAVSIQPREVPADGLRKLPAAVARPAPNSANAPAHTANGDAPSVTPPVMALMGPVPAAPAALALPSALPRPLPRSTIEPVAADRWQWRIGLNGALKAKLDRLRGYLGHKFPDGDLDKVFAQMLDDSLAKHGKRLGHVEPERPRKPAPPKAPTPGKRAPVTVAVRRAVLKRDGFRCTWVTPDGERCPCTTRLEMDHIDPAAETGLSGVDELTTRCRAHNQYRAFLRYGAEHVKRRMEEDRRAREARRIAKAPPGPGTLCEPVAPWRPGPVAAAAPSRPPARAAPWCRPPYAAARRTQKRDPSGPLSTPTSPLIAWTRCFTMARPRPVPPCSRERPGSTR